jgi:prepilin-type N-terminal cleavage/methylation domain-containing protein
MCGFQKVRRIGLRRASPRQGGYTLVEMCVAMIIICILVSISAPMYNRAIEQARLDSAAGNLKTIWSAQRAYWLKFHTFASDLTTLENEDLISASLVETQTLPNARYVYDIDSAGADSFVASASRSSSNSWNGEIQVNEFGQLTGSISKADGTTLSHLTLE